MGAVSALAEVMTERIGLDEMLHLPKDWEDAGFWKGLARGAGGEAAEEGLTNIVNLAADLTIAGENSEFARSIEQYKAEGKDDAAALEAALKDAGISLGLDMLGGGISGVVFGGVDGWRSKRAADSAVKKENAAAEKKAGSAEQTGGTEAVPYGEDSGVQQTPQSQSAGESVETAPVAGAAEENSAAETVSAQAVQEDVQKGPETVAGTDADLTATAQRVQPGSLKAVVMESVNPLITGKLHTARTEQLARLVGNAQTDLEVMEATAKVYGASSETVQQVKTAMELTGLTRVVFDHGESTGGKRAAAWFDQETRVIHIDPAAKSPTLVLYGHEMTHRIEQTDGYNSFSQLVLDRIEDSGTDLAALRAEKRAEYAQGGRKLTDSDVDREIVAQYAAENLLSNEADIRALVDRSRTLGQRIRECLDYWLAKLGNRDAQERQFLTKARDLYVQALDQSDKLDERYIREQERVAEAREMGLSEEEYDALQGLDEEDLGDGDDANALSAGMDLMLEDDLAEQDSGKIYPGMDEQERAEVLRKKTIRAPVYVDGNPVTDAAISQLEGKYGKEAKTILKELLEHCGTVYSDYNNTDAEISFRYSNRSFSESFNKQANRTAEFVDFGKMLTVLPDIASGAVEIEAHTDKYAETKRSDIRLKEMHVLLGAFSDGTSVVPVQMEVKEYKAGTGMENKLYVTVTMKKEAGITPRGSDASKANVSIRGTPASEFSLTDIVANVKDETGGLVKYLPDELLNQEQVAWKEAALERDGIRLGDMRYEYAVEKGMTDRTNEMLEMQASDKGYERNGEQYRNAAGSVKSAGVTYDKGGRLIPLSKRFDPENPDTQYALEDGAEAAGEEIPEAARFSEFERTMPAQVQRSLKMARNELVRTVGKALGVSANDRNGKLKLAAENLNNEYIMHDVVSRESIEAFWDQAVELGTVEPTEEARAAFDEAIRKLEQTYERATRYLNELYEQQVPEDGTEEESRTPPPAPEPEAELTPEEAGELMKQCKKARSKADRLAKMAMLRDSDKEKIHLLLRGEMQPHELDPATDNVADILEVYEARKEYEELAKQVRQYKGKIKKHRTDTADKLTATVTSWKDKKSGFGYSRETMERNVRDIVGSKRLAKKINAEYFEPVHKAAAAELKFKAEMRARVEKLNISTKAAKGNTHSESYAVQFLGEALSHIQVLEKSRNMNARREGKTLREWEAEVAEFRRQNPNLDETSIRAKIQEFRKIYDELLDQVNTVRIRNGYEPVNRIEGYFPHFQMMEQTGFWGGVKKALGFKADITPLPATINGRTAGFKPGIRWMANAQARTGFQTTYDAIEGFERYLNSAADVIYLTDCIQNLRAFASQIRYNASPEGLRKQIDRINANPDIDEEQRRAAIEQVYKKGKFAGSHFVAELDEYTNLLAGKRSAGDREMERLFGRGAYNVAKWAEQKTGANMVAANIGSALTNFIPMTQGFAVLKSRYFFRGMADTMRGEWKRDGFRGNSTFLTNRMGETQIARTWMDKASEKAGWLMEWIDMLSAETITRGRYYQNLSRDMSEQAAMDEADAWAAGLMGDRSKGGMPTIFQQSNPVAKLFTQFQLEVNNQFSFMLKDIPKDFEDEVIKHIALFLLKWILSQYLFNDVYEYFVGRRPAFDVGNMVNEFVGDLTGYELPNLIELGIHAAKGEELGFETEKEGFGGALTNLAGNVAEELPFTPAANLIGIEIDGGRVPVASAIPDLSVIGDVIGNPDWSWEKRWKELGDELAKPLTYLIPPFGGGQAKKAVEAASAYWQNGRYTMDKDGNLLLQFPMGSVPDAVQAALFGTTSTKAGREWVEDGFGSLTAKQTQAYKSLVDGGMDTHEAYGIISTLRTAEKTDEQSRTQVQRQLLMESGLTDSQKQTVYRVMISEDYDEKIAKFREAGMDMDDFLTAQLQHGAIKTQYEDEGDMATAFARWVNQQGYSASQKQVIRDCFKYWKMMPADADRYDRGIEAGLSDADAAQLVEDLKAVTPLEGEDNVKQYQNWRVAIDNAVNEKNQLTLLKSVGMNDASYAKCEALWNTGVAPAAYVRAKELESQFNEDGKGSLKNTEWTKLIDSMTTTGIVLAGDNTRFNLTNEQKGFFWQMLTGSKSTKNNPYSVRGGEKWLEIKEGMEEEVEE